ncbi:MAG TPA: helix-turn-helix transcriptional regulator [Streptosporangiaceae bacterium]|nr:helix-turn-helix transcriptional regulator [Streptosporangiaceae bacterium]
MSPVTASTIGSFIREQREQAKISMRQLAQAAGVSNPYLSQVERGLRRPSADILQQIAKGLRISAEALYVQAGILDDRPADTSVADAVMTDPELTERQKQMLIEIYESFRKEVRADAEARAALAAASAELDPASEEATAAAGSAEHAVTDAEAAAGWLETLAEQGVTDAVPRAARPEDLAEQAVTDAEAAAGWLDAPAESAASDTGPPGEPEADWPPREVYAPVRGTATAADGLDDDAGLDELAAGLDETDGLDDDAGLDETGQADMASAAGAGQGWTGPTGEVSAATVNR